MPLNEHMRGFICSEKFRKTKYSDKQNGEVCDRTFHLTNHYKGNHKVSYIHTLLFLIPLLRECKTKHTKLKYSLAMANVKIFRIKGAFRKSGALS